MILSDIFNSRPPGGHFCHDSSMVREGPISNWSGCDFSTMLCQNSQSKIVVAVNILWSMNLKVTGNFGVQVFSGIVGSKGLSDPKS